MSSHRPRRLIPLPACLAGALTLCLSGCAVFDKAPAEASQGSAFSWLTNWVSQPFDVAPGFDVESLRPEPKPAYVSPGDLLEVTVWDLNEPGQPYTFPVRVSDKRTIEVPLLSEFSVVDRTVPEIESGLVHGYRAGEFLLNPRILVRPLDPPTVKVQASGAVQRPGYVELSRTDTSVYAALMSAGGLRKTASTQVAVIRRTARLNGDSGASEARSRNSSRGMPIVTPLTTPPEGHANSLDELSVTSAARAHEVPAVSQTAAQEESGIILPEGVAPQWFNLTRAEDRDALRSLRLVEGDEVIVKAALAPIRIGGVVRRPGAYPLPPGRNLDVWQAIDEAGGVVIADSPLNITLIRPAAEGRPARRWFLHVEQYDQHPPTSRLLEAGDVLHIEPTTGSKIKRAVGDLWSKP